VRRQVTDRGCDDLTVAMRDYWWAKYGWATHGSKLQTQLYVNRRREALTAGVLEALPTLREREPTLEWVVPLEKPISPDLKAFAEPRDGRMLAALDQSQLTRGLANFWPARGPVWDALAICRFPDGTKGAVLAEGKNYPREMYSGGTGAGKSGSPAALKSRQQIERATAWVQGRLGLPLDPERWLDPLDRTRPGSSLYQTANRLAYTVWLRSRGIDAWLCHLLYVDDQLHHPTSRSAWEQRLAQADRELGIEGLELPFAGHAWLDALDPDTELADLRHGGVRSSLSK
jgi:hypothetical protein